MIVSSKDDMVRLSGVLVKNQWLTIKAAANLLMRDHPEGILIDCSGLEHVSEDGAITFLEAMKDIQAAGARIVVCNLPDNVLQVIRSVPGVRSQLPISASVEEARASLRMSGSTLSFETDKAPLEHTVLVPLMPNLDYAYALIIASRASRELRAQVNLVCFMTVARNLPLTAPLPEQEATANRLIEGACQEAKRLGMPYSVHVERVREPLEGMMQAIRNYKSSLLILSASADQLESTDFMELAEAMLNRAPCNVAIGRRAVEEGAGR